MRKRRREGRKRGREGERERRKRKGSRIQLFKTIQTKSTLLTFCPGVKGGSNTCLRVVIPVDTLVMPGLNYQVKEEVREGIRIYPLVLPLTLHLRQQRLVTSFFYLGSLYSDDRSS